MTLGNRPNEPSMEEILASIRRIITENDEITDLKDETSLNQNADEVDSDVVSLANPETSINDENVLLLSCELQDDGTVKDWNTGEIKKPTGINSVIAQEDSISSNGSVHGSATPFSGMASIVYAQLREPGTFAEGKTIDDLVKEVMRPMIREWLDNNLPELVERAVNKEIKQVMRDADELTRT